MSDFIVNNSIHIPWSELNFSYSRSRGPGGQNVNKVNSKATLHWNVVQTEAISQAIKARFLKKWETRINKNGSLVISSETSRDQKANVNTCLSKLKQMLLDAAQRPKARLATKPSISSQKRVQEAKRKHSSRKSERRQSKQIPHHKD